MKVLRPSRRGESQDGFTQHRCGAGPAAQLNALGPPFGRPRGGGNPHEYRRTGAAMNVEQLQQGVEAGDGAAVEAVIAALDEGRLRVCEPDGERWVTHAWIKRAVL